MRRRELLVASAALAAAPLLETVARAGAAAPSDPPFDYAWLKGQARALATRAYVPPPDTLPPAVARLDWDHWQAIRFRPQRALWADQPLPFRIEFFHLGLLFRHAVRMHVVEQGTATPLPYDPAAFDLTRAGLDATALDPRLGFAGFRIHFHKDFAHDVAAFLGSNYFRAVGATGQYGLSARGLAVDCGLARPEEFPDFTAFWFERPEAGAATLTLYALLDSPSIAGAYRFDVTPGPTQVMRIDAAL